jgi:hypothetical protein
MLCSFPDGDGHWRSGADQVCLRVYGDRVSAGMDGYLGEPIRRRELPEAVELYGGRRGDRTPDLCIANAALSQLS